MYIPLYFKENNSYKKNKNIIVLFLLLSIIISHNQKNIKVCLCVIAKNENLYIKEFVEYYKNIGYNKIFIYDNNEQNGENFVDVIKDYIIIGFVEIIHFKNINSNSTPQLEAYKDCYYKNNKIFNWLSFFDVDEYLELNKKYKNVKYFLTDKKFKNCKNIKINWLFYFDKNKLYYENKTLQERIKVFKYDDPVNSHIKSIVRGGLSTNYWKEAKDPHTSLLNVTSCSSSGKIIEFDSPFNKPPDYTNAKLKHYCYKSFEEYCLKLKKGRADCNKNKGKEILYNTLKGLYVQIKNNSEKLKIFNRLFNDSTFINISL